MTPKQKMHERLDRREEQIQSWFAKLRRLVDAEKIGGEEGRLWLDKFAVGRGLNIACGDFPIGESWGVDFDPRKVAIDYWGFGDKIIDDEFENLDFIVTNYFEYLHDPLKVLSDWSRVLKSDGILAMVMGDTDNYENSLGPLENKRRRHCFTLKTITCYLTRAGFKLVDYEIVDRELRIVAKKR